MRRASSKLTLLFFMIFLISAFALASRPERVSPSAILAAMSNCDELRPFSRSDVKLDGRRW
jgi:hypothetical protein